MADGPSDGPGQVNTMKALVVGYGSIGQRHLSNLLRFKNVKKIFILTKRPDLTGSRFVGSRKIEVIKSLSGIKADFAVICNATYKHAGLAIKLAKKKMHLFIEKPVAHDVKSAKKLLKITGNKSIRTAVGYNLRFIKALRYVKKLIDAGTLGKLYFARIEAGQYLPDWRPGRPYKGSYSASKKMGGGVALDLSHEVDYMRYLFGDPSFWKVFKAKTSRLNIDSEDLFEGIYLFGDDFICSVHLDYLQKNKRRCMSIYGSKGALECDFVKKRIILKRQTGKDIVIDKKGYFDLNGTYAEEMRDFINAIEHGTKVRVDLKQGVKAVELLEDGACTKNIK
jgi:predicted dehydrogenase